MTGMHDGGLLRDGGMHDPPFREPLDAERCNRCGGRNIQWSAPSPLWNEVMRGGSINGIPLFNDCVCPICFVLLAEEQGIASRWRLHAERVAVPLETVTPTGRIWDEKTWLWRSAAAEERP